MKKNIIAISLTAIVGYFIFKQFFRSNNLGNIVKNQIIRPCDPKGCGHYGAKRGDHTHQGIDILAKEGEVAFAPITGVVRKLFVYQGSTQMKGVEIKNKEQAIKIFYVDASNLINGQTITKGTLLGFVQNISAYHNAEGVMLNHLHVEVVINGKKINPLT